MSESFTQTVDATTAIKTRLTREQLSAKVTFRRADGSRYNILEKNVMDTAQRYDDLFILYVKHKVVKSDFEAFGANLKSYFATKLGMHIQYVLGSRCI